MAGVSAGHRHVIAQVAFVLLVILIPVTAGLGWAEHQRTSDFKKVTEQARLHAILDDWQLYDAQLAQCRRVKVVRANLNNVIRELHAQGFDGAVAVTPQTDCLLVTKHPGSPRPPATATELNPGG